MIRPPQPASQSLACDKSIALGIGRYVTGLAKGRDSSLGALVVPKLPFEQRA